MKVSETTTLKKRAEQKEVNFHYPNTSTVSISLNETTTISDLNLIISIFSEVSDTKSTSIQTVKQQSRIRESVQRNTEFLTHNIFNSHHSETELMRYIKRLERKDLALNFSMISLGSCTMKLNAAVEMLPLSWPNWGNIHPFAPLNQVEGYRTVLTELEAQLTEITGFSGTSLQPNSGAQGEFA